MGMCTGGSFCMSGPLIWKNTKYKCRKLVHRSWDEKAWMLQVILSSSDKDRPYFKAIKEHFLTKCCLNSEFKSWCLFPSIWRLKLFKNVVEWSISSWKRWQWQRVTSLTVLLCKIKMKSNIEKLCIWILMTLYVNLFLEIVKDISAQWSHVTGSESCAHLPTCFHSVSN